MDNPEQKRRPIYSGAFVDEFKEWRYEPVRLNCQPCQAANLTNDDRYGNAGEEPDENRAREECCHNAKPQQTRCQAYPSDKKRDQRCNRGTVNRCVRRQGDVTIDVTAAASTVMVAASGPTIRILEGPNRRSLSEPLCLRIVPSPEASPQSPGRRWHLASPTAATASPAEISLGSQLALYPLRPLKTGMDKVMAWTSGWWQLSLSMLQKRL